MAKGLAALSDDLFVRFIVLLDICGHMTKISHMTNEAIDQAFYVATALLAALGVGLAISLWWM